MMKEIKIKKKSWIWNLVPLAGRHKFATTIGHTVFLTPRQFKGYYEGNIRRVALVRHEETHIRQLEREGWRYIFGYIFSRKARLQYEIEAYGVQIRHLRDNGETADYILGKIERIAKNLNKVYMVGVPHDKILTMLYAEMNRGI